MIAKTILQIKIRAKNTVVFVEYFRWKCKYKSSYFGENRLGRRLGRPEIGVFLYIYPSNCSCTCICNGFNQQIPRIFTNLTPI